MIDLYKELDKVNERIDVILGILGIHGKNISNVHIYYFRYKCGHPKCKCRNGGLGHGPYPRLQYRQSGELKIKYVTKRATDDFKKKYGESFIIPDALAEIKKLEAKRKKIKKSLKSYESLIKELGYEN